MHELSIVQKIVAAADEAAKKNNISKVAKLQLRLGQMAAAQPEQLQFGFKTYSKGSRLEGAVLEIENVPVELQCNKCHYKFNDPRFNDIDFAHTIAHAPMAYDNPPCPKCHSKEAVITRGKEMELVNLEGE